MSQLDAYLFFNGTCAEAMRFYERALGGKLELLMKVSEGPPDTGRSEGSTPDPDAILHACVEVQGRRLMASDWLGDQKYPGMGGFSLALNYETVPEARRVFDTLAEGGSINMPLGQTFWVEAFGMVVDRFGTPWMVSGGKQAN